MDQIKPGESYYRHVLDLIKSKINSDVWEYVRYIDARLSIDYETGSTLLHYAAMFGNRILTKRFISFGFDVNAQNKAGKTPLMLAITGQHIKTIKTLLRRNANIHLRDVSGRSAIDMIFDNLQPVRPEIIEMFFARIKQKSPGNEDLANLLYDVNCPLDRLMYLKNAEVTRMLIHRGRSVNYQDANTGITALHIAVDNVDLENVKVLLDEGVDVNLMDKYYQTALLRSTRFHRSPNGLDILKLLLERDISLIARDFLGVMQAFSVFIYGDKSAVKMLLDHGVDFEVTDAHGKTMLHYLALNRNPGITDLLKGKKIHVNACDRYGGTVLHVAARIGNVSTVTYLLKNGADVNARDYNRGVSPLFFALMDSPESDEIKQTVELLMKYGADPQFVSSHHETIFDEVLKYRNFKLIEPVLAHLALLEIQGTVITDLTRQKIHLHPRMSNYFILCQKQLRHIRPITLYGSVNLINLLTDSERKVEIYARNPIIVAKLARLNEKNSEKSYYVDSIRERFAKAMEVALLRAKTERIIAFILGFGNSSNPIVVEKIVSYLDYHDLSNFA